MKRELGLRALKLYGRTVLAAFISTFMYLSIMILGMAFSSGNSFGVLWEPTGTDAYYLEISTDESFADAAQVLPGYENGGKVITPADCETVGTSLRYKVTGVAKGTDYHCRLFAGGPSTDGTPVTIMLSKFEISLLENLIALILQAILFSLIIYAEMWDQGDKAHTLARHHVAFTEKSGWHIGLLSSAPAILSWILLLAEKAFGFWPGYTTVYRVCHLALYPIVSLCMGTTWSVPAAQISWWGILGAGLPILFPIVAAGLTFSWGFRGINVSERLVYGKKKNKES